eukprot:TRINITY_DN22059_c0_g1_i2.p1 TRINITY_DN22059_c0_g1~~TRINITY_DN22059_c0_g1_i2.p1  ORF type:complete len:359 (-),score=44.17 TRINITY_DN22059_c0_g1_i2:89-1165(-)
MAYQSAMIQPVQYQFPLPSSPTSRYVALVQPSGNSVPVTAMPTHSPTVVALPRARRSFHSAAPAQCADDECVEEECNPNLCGTERLPPRKEEMLWGCDIRPLLPILLFWSTVGGAIGLFWIGGTVFARGMELNFLGQVLWSFPPGVLYLTTLMAMLYCAFSDPGQVNEDEEAEEDGKALPPRSHKAWMYTRPVRRYDHYCRWVCNVIGLYNHRTFVILLFGIVGIAILGFLFDVCCLVYLHNLHREGAYSLLSTYIVYVHMAYSGAVWWLAGPILRIHVGLISRNELAFEWKENFHYVVLESRKGPNWPVDDLSDDEHNELFDHFVYDPRRNMYDHGIKANLWAFWFTSRDEDELGSF